MARRAGETLRRRIVTDTSEHTAVGDRFAAGTADMESAKKPSSCLTVVLAAAESLTGMKRFIPWRIYQSKR